MMQMSIFDILEPRIKRIKCENMDYEIGKGEVAEIKLTNHGDEKTIIYELSDKNGNLIIFIGMLQGHDVVWE